MRIMKEKQNQLPLIIDEIMMVKIFENNSISLDCKDKNKTADLHSFERTQIMPEILEMIYSPSIHLCDLENLLLNCPKQPNIFLLELSQNLINLENINVHNELHHLLNSAADIFLTADFLDCSLILWTNSFFNGNSSTGYQSIESQNFWSSSESVPVLINCSNIPLLISSSWLTSDQLTQENLSIRTFTSSSNGIIILANQITPFLTKSSNFSNCSNLRIIPFLATSGQLTSGSLSNFALSSSGTNIVNRFIINPPHKRVITHKCVEIYKPFETSQSHHTKMGFV